MEPRALSLGETMHNYQRAVRIEGARGSAQIVQLLHGALHRFTSATMDAISSPPPHSISFGGFRTPAAEYAAPSLKRPASETLHTSRLMHCNKKHRYSINQ